MDTKASKKFYKVVVVGEVNSGKTTFVKCYTGEVIPSEYKPTIKTGSPSFKKITEKDGSETNIQLWDIGDEDTEKIKGYLSGADGIIIMVDYSNPSCAIHIQDWMKSLSRFASPEIPRLVVLNKSDLMRGPEGMMDVVTTDVLKVCDGILNPKPHIVCNTDKGCADFAMEHLIAFMKSNSLKMNKLTRKVYKVVVVGDKNVGKTSIVKRYTQGVFHPRYKETIGVDYGIKKMIDSDGEEIHIQFWDVAGLEINGKMFDTYCKDANGFIIVAEGFNKDEVNTASKYLTKIMSFTDNHYVPIMIMQNKFDLLPYNKFTETLADGSIKSKTVDSANGILEYMMEKMMPKYNFLSSIVSAKNGLGIDEAMADLVSRMNTKGSFKVEEVIKAKVHKVCILGDSGVGKSAIVRRYINGNYDKFYKATVGMNRTSTQIKNADGTLSEVIFTDVAGREMESKLTSTYLQDATAVLVVCDYTNEQSIGSVCDWYNGYASDLTLPLNIPMKLLINKTDEKSSYVCTKAIYELVKTFGKDVEYVSAKDDARAFELKKIINSLLGIEYTMKHMDIEKFRKLLEEKRDIVLTHDEKRYKAKTVTEVLYRKNGAYFRESKTGAHEQCDSHVYVVKCNDNGKDAIFYVNYWEGCTFYGPVVIPADVTIESFSNMEELKHSLWKGSCNVDIRDKLCPEKPTDEDSDSY